MKISIWKDQWYCRWCGCTYTPIKQTERDGFCSPACKQALHRAYKKYTTSRDVYARSISGSGKVRLRIKKQA